MEKLSCRLIFLIIFLTNIVNGQEKENRTHDAINTSQAIKNQSSIPFASYPFNNSADDVSGSGRHGTPYGLTTIPDRSGVENSAYSFNGTTSYIQLPFNSSNFSNVLTITAWVRRSKNGVGGYNQGIVSNDNKNDRGLLLGSSPANTFYISMFNTSGSQVDLECNTLPTEWHFVAMVYDGSSLKAYQNGVLKNSTPMSGNVRGNMNFCIGKDLYDSNQNRFWGGYIDDVNFYDYALSGKEIEILYQGANIVVDYPNGGELILIDTIQNIQWSSFGTSGEVEIELSRDGGSSWEYIKTNTDDDSSESWVVMGPSASNCLIRISDVDGSPIDTSDAEFTIDSAGVNHTPVLLWTGLTNYINDGVHPDSGLEGTEFEFRVIYKDLDGDPPSPGFPKLHIQKGQIEISGSPFSLTSLNMNEYNQGRIFGISQSIDIGGDDYQYYFEAFDENNALATGAPTSPQNLTVVHVFASYPFNNSADDMSGNERHGSGYDLTETIDRFGDVNSAYGFNGFSAYIQLPFNARIFSNSITITAWVYRSADCAAGYLQGIVSNDRDSDRGMLLGLNQSNNLFVGLHSTGGSSISVEADFLPKGWHFIAIVYDGTALKVYQNGSLTRHAFFSGNLGGNYNFCLGRNTFSDDTHHFFGGDIDDVNLYSYPLSEQEIGRLYGGSAIIVRRPNGGESFAIGSNLNLNWYSWGTSGQVKIDLSRDGGSSWETIQSNTSDDYAEAWTATNPPASNCLIKISDIDGAPFDISNAEFAILQPGYISGKVYQNDGETPIPDAIILIRKSDSAIAGEERSDSQGNYMSKGLLPGSYSVQAPGTIITQGEIYFPEYYHELPGYDEKTLVSVTSSNITAGIDFTLEPNGCGVSGFVVQSDGMTPIANTEINFYDQSWNKLATTLSDVDGKYFKILPPSTSNHYFVSATGYVKNQGDIYLQEYYSDRTDSSNADMIMGLYGNKVRNVNFTLIKWATSISGTVYQSDGITPISDCIVTLYDNSWTCRRSDTTDSQGNYLIAGLTAGNYYISAHYCQYYFDSPDRAGADLVAVTEGEMTAGINFTLKGICPNYYDSHSAQKGSLITFNNPGDGRIVEVLFNDLVGNGNVEVLQYNFSADGAPGSNSAPFHYNIIKENSISTFSATINFHYLDADVAGIIESSAFLGVARNNDTTQSWQWLGGVVDAKNNMISVSGVNSFSTFTLYRRLFGDINNDGYVDAVDLQLLTDCWHATNAAEFDAGSDARFFNYDKRADLRGQQIINAADLQVFADCWHNGKNPSGPVANFSVDPDSGDITTFFNFNASDCTDDKDPISALLVRWDWENDGTWDTEFSTNKTAIHQYTTPGTKIIKMEVRDSDGFIDSIIKPVTVNTASTNTLTDIDGNLYHIIKIGNQWWLAENLKVTHYRNGDPIPNVTNESDWSALAGGAYCNYLNNESFAATYGRMYNWFVVHDGRNIAPTGWHVPSASDWQVLIDYLGGMNVAGGMMKEIGTEHWSNPNFGATNESDFTALPGGYRHSSGYFSAMGAAACFWSSTENALDKALYYELHTNTQAVANYNYLKIHGFSIRCVKD